MRRLICLGCVSGLVLGAFLAPEARAEKKVIKLTKTWTGSRDDRNLQKGAPQVITNAKAFAKLWKAWKIEGKVPKVDFKKELVILATTVGSRLNLSAQLDDKGNLTTLGFGTRDLRPGFRYVMGTVPRKGVKTVNGKALPKE
jgi:hypothetical protein